MTHSWLIDLMKSVDAAESPRPFFYWSALSVVSAIVRNQVYLDKFMYKLYPNIFVMLVAKSGLRKGVPIKMAKELVTLIGNTRIFAGRGSIQGIINELSKAHTLPSGLIIKDATGFIVSSEFSSSFVQDPQTFTLLTDLYDSDYNSGEWKNVIKGTGTETLKDVSLTMLSATNQSHFKSTISDTDVSGGFIGRTLIVTADKKQQVNALVKRPLQTFNAADHIEYLKELAKLKGEFNYYEDSDDIYEAWYTKFSSDIEDADDKTGTLDRLHDHVLKVAMLLSLCRSPDLRILPEDIINAVKSCEMLTLNVKKTIIGSGKGQMAPQTGAVLTLLMKQPELKIGRKRLLQRLWGDLDANELDRVIETLIQAGAVKVFRDENKELSYELKQEFYDQYRSMKGGKT
jgi:hypothetical protein